MAYQSIPKDDYVVVEHKPSMPPPHSKYHLNMETCYFPHPHHFTNLGHGPVTYLYVL